jgi:hypothetical protein
VRHEDHLGRKSFAAFHHDDTLSVAGRFHCRDLLAQPQRHAALACEVRQCIHQLAIHHVEYFGAFVDERDRNAERGKNRRIFQTDDAGANDRHRARQTRQRQDVVTGQHGLMIHDDAGGQTRRRAHRNHDVRRLENHRGHAIVHRHRVRRRKSRHAFEHVHAVALQLRPDHVALAPDHGVAAEQQILHRDVVLRAVRAAVQHALAQSRQIQYRFTQRLAGNRTGIDAHAADVVALLDDRDRLAELRSLYRGALPGGAAAQNDEIEGLHEVSELSSTEQWCPAVRERRC